MAIVTLLTDFGLKDSYAGEMKGAILRRSPSATIVDVTHEITPGAIREAAWILWRSWSAFPNATVHVAVVDPGVGSSRRAVAARAHGHLFVAPDNGLLYPVLAADPASELREIRRDHRSGTSRGTTFDGRDLFAPLAGALASGIPFTEVGPPASDPIALEPFRILAKGDFWRVEVVAVDRYGNLITCASESFLRATFDAAWREIRVASGSMEIRKVRDSYQDVLEGELLLSIGSAGTLEISENGGSASQTLGLKVGDSITIEPPR